MGGVGRAPKDPALRRNRVPPSRGEWIDLGPLDQPVLPVLPRRGKDEGPWTTGAKMLWAAWRSDPVSAQWSPADVAYALETIALRNDMKPSTAGEIRLRMDSLGLTPKGKRDLRWRIVPEAEVQAKPKLAEVRRLRAVDPQAS